MTREEIKHLMIDNGFIFLKTTQSYPGRRGLEDVYTRKPEYKFTFRISKVNDTSENYGLYSGRSAQFRALNEKVRHDVDVANIWGADRPLPMWTGDNIRILLSNLSDMKFLHPSDHYESREELYKAGLHNSYMKGIGKAKDGTGNMSIVLSGGYADDEDFGSVIIYTGEGGRDSNTGKQISDQVIEAGNKDLVSSFELGLPVYVIRGSNHKSDYSPKSGYEFAGEFYISEHWIETGSEGYRIVRFKLTNDLLATRREDAATPVSRRIEYVSNRIIRDTKLAKRVKELYDSTCQVCGVRIELPSGSKYAEGAHIQPLGMPHDGPDMLENLLCLCPNHHLMFDKYCYSINPATLKLEGLSGELNVSSNHHINSSYLKYHYENYLVHKE